MGYFAGGTAIQHRWGSEIGGGAAARQEDTICGNPGNSNPPWGSPEE